jgi:(1->4)-alpha-D-glucan 1-alpha-D-glucosylmutase
LRALRLRRAERALFAEGAYQPLVATGARADHVLAFARTHEDRAVVAVVGRRFARLGATTAPPVGELWLDTKVVLPDSLASRRWRDALTDRPVGPQSGLDGSALPVAELFAHLPVALLIAA